jgi:hypothetical protein
MADVLLRSSHHKSVSIIPARWFYSLAIADIMLATFPWLNALFRAVYAHTAAADIHGHSIATHSQSRHHGAKLLPSIYNYKLQVDPGAIRIINGGSAGAVCVDC